MADYGSADYFVYPNDSMYGSDANDSIYFFKKPTDPELEGCIPDILQTEVEVSQFPLKAKTQNCICPKGHVFKI